MSESIIIERTPDIIAVEIRTLCNQFKQLALSYAIDIGRRLCEAKELVDHGEWTVWLEEKTEFGKSTAENLMRIFKEYGADQVGLFGDSKSQTLGNLSYTKALKLLSVPTEEREEFAQEHDVENLSTRELEKIIKERDEALDAKAAAEKLLEKAKADYADAVQNVEDTETDLLKLKAELKAIQERPIDVAVMEADPSVIEEAKAEARKEAEAELKKKIEKAAEAEKKAKDKLEDLTKKHASELKKLSEELDLAKASKSTENAEELRKAVEAAEAALKRAETAEKKLAVADPGITQFLTLSEQAQGLLNKMLALANEAQDEKGAKMKNAMTALLDGFGVKLKETAA